MAKLAGKVALITGAAGGQGTVEAELFVREGAAVMLTDVDAAKGEALAKRLRDQGGRAQFRVQDVASEQSWIDTVAATLAAFGGLHILVNNAGTIARQGIVATTLEAWNRTLGGQSDRAAARHEARRAGDPRIRAAGSIVNISSTAGLTAHDDAAYTASKWGLRGLTKTAVLQFSPWNIRVNSIHPGQIADTGFFASGGEGFAHAARAAIPHAPPGHAARMRRTGAVPCLRGGQLYQRRRDRDRRRLHRRRPRHLRNRVRAEYTPNEPPQAG